MASAELPFEKLSLQQLSELEYILLGDLRDVLEEESNDQNRKWLAAIVDTLLETLPREFALRSDGGYMEDVLMVCPEADANVRQLENEQWTLCGQLEELSRRLHSASSYKRHADRLKKDLTIWTENLTRHNVSEERLVQDIYLQDTGGGD